MTVFDRPPLSFVDFRFPTDLGGLQGGTARCPAEISSSPMMVVVVMLLGKWPILAPF